MNHELTKKNFSEVKQVEKRDAVLTKEQQIERLTKPGSKVTFETLQNSNE